MTFNVVLKVISERKKAWHMIIDLCDFNLAAEMNITLQSSNYRLFNDTFSSFNISTRNAES